MEPKNEIITTPIGSDTVGVGGERDIVPVVPPSLSDDGQSMVCVAGTMQDLATVAVVEVSEQIAASDAANSSLSGQLVQTTVEMPIRTRENTADTIIMSPSPERSKEILSPMVPDSWITIMEEEEKLSSKKLDPPIDVDMETEDFPIRTATKRKKARNLDTDSLEDDSTSDATKDLRCRTRSRRKRTPLPTADKTDIVSKDCETPIGSNQDSALSGTDKEDRKGKVGRPRRKTRAVDPILAEQEILKKTGVSPEHIEEEILRAMTAAEVCTQALEYISNIELIRTKCGRIQGGLSGELRKMSQGLGELVRELQYKAEAVGDPNSLKSKIEELLNDIKKSNKDREKEEERRKREKSEFLEIIADLKKENLEIRKENREIKAELRKEMKDIRASLDRDSSERNNTKEDTERKIDENKRGKKKVSFEREMRPLTSPQPQRRSMARGANLTSYNMNSPTESTRVFQHLEEDLQEAHRVTGGNEWPVDGESWSSPPPVNKKRKLDNESKLPLRSSRQSRHIFSPDGISNDSTGVLPTSRQEVFSMEGIPSTSRGIPTMIFSGSGTALAATTPQPRCFVKENIQLVPPREDYIESKKTYASILKKDKVSIPTYIQKDKVSTYLQKDKISTYLQTRSEQVPEHKQEWFTIGKKGKPIQQPVPKISKRQNLKNLIKKERRKLPATAAISIRGSKKDFDYADALKRARQNISLQELDIKNPKIRKGISGSTIIEISGPDNVKKADLLAMEMSKIFTSEAKISRPNIKGEIKLTGLDESISTNDICEAIVSEGPCKSSDITVGQIGRNRYGDGIVWIKCPKAAALALAEKKKLQIGWSRVTVELLPNRPIQCHKCWSLGHVRSNCRSNKDYSGRCFRCGEKDHKVDTCKNKAKCVICAERHLSDNHRMGSNTCKVAKMTPSPRTSTETEVDNTPPKDTSSTPPSEAGKMKSPSIESSPEKEQEDIIPTATSIEESERLSERRTDVSMEITELE